MAGKLNEERLQELGAYEYKMLKSVYCTLRELKGLVGQVRADYVENGVPPEFDTVEAMHLIVEDLFSDVERYLRPECDPDSAYKPAMPES